MIIRLHRTHIVNPVSHLLSSGLEPNFQVVDYTLVSTWRIDQRNFWLHESIRVWQRWTFWWVIFYDLCQGLVKEVCRVNVCCDVQTIMTKDTKQRRIYLQRRRLLTQCTQSYHCLKMKALSIPFPLALSSTSAMQFASSQPCFIIVASSVWVDQRLCTIKIALHRAL